MTIVGITFGTEQYLGSAAVLRHSALTTGGFDEFRVFEKKDIEWLMDTYPNHFENSRGFGWWAWKPFLIRNVMNQLPDGDTVVYCDSTMYFERSIKPYIDHVENTNPILLCRLGSWSDKKNDYRNKRWTKKSVFNIMGAGNTAAEEIQLNAAFQVYKNSPETRAFVDQYLQYCLNLDIVNDEGRDGEIFDTRHDQSILSILASEHPRVTFSRDISQWGRQDPPCSISQPAGGAVELDTLDENGIMYNLVNHHRRIMKIPKIAVITPTTGGKFLDACIKSVQSSTLPNIEHWIIVDGREHEGKVDMILEKYRHKHPIIKLALPNNVGSGGWCGHRVYGSIPWIINADYISYLDDDNIVDPKHFKDLVSSIISTPNASWSYCLRKLIDGDGNLIGYDNCESLGGISHTVAGRGDYLIDTSCYMIERELAISASPIWNARFRDPNGKQNPDRELPKFLLSSAPYGVVRKHSLNYRIGSTGLSVTNNFFVQGNGIFGYDFEKYEDIYVFHFSEKATSDFMAARRQYKTRSYALEEWQMTLLKGLDGMNGGKYNLLNGFTNFPNIPNKATVLVNLCNPGDLPMDFFKERVDLHRIVYTLESPNIRHQGQWNFNWLTQHFDVALTYFKPIIENKSIHTVFTPHNTHHGDLDDPRDAIALLRVNKGVGKSAGMVLERRPHLFHTRDYAINGVHLRCLDYLREDLVRGLEDVTVFGINWGEVADGKKIKLGHAKHRSQDENSSVDLKSKFVFDIVVENCDAEGYVSEKLYDSLSAGCVPLYYGNMYDELSDLIPEGEVYFDLKKRNITTGKQLQELLNTLNDERVEEMRKNVIDYREKVLRYAGTKMFAKKVEEAIDLVKTTKKNVELV